MRDKEEKGELMRNRMPPGKNMDDLWTILRSGMWRLWYKLSSEGKTRFYSEFLPLLHRTKHDVMVPRDDDSYYLVYLGSKPSARGKGYAKKLNRAYDCQGTLLFSHFLQPANAV